MVIHKVKMTCVDSYDSYEELPKRLQVASRVSRFALPTYKNWPDHSRNLLRPQHMVPFGENEISRAYDEIGLTLLLLVATGVAINHVFDSQLFALSRWPLKLEIEVFVLFVRSSKVSLGWNGSKSSAEISNSGVRVAKYIAGQSLELTAQFDQI